MWPPSRSRRGTAHRWRCESVTAPGCSTRRPRPGGPPPPRHWPDASRQSRAMSSPPRVSAFGPARLVPSVQSFLRYARPPCADRLSTAVRVGPRLPRGPPAHQPGSVAVAVAAALAAALAAAAAAAAARTGLAVAVLVPLAVTV